MYKSFSNKDKFLSILGKKTFVSKSQKCKSMDLEEQLKVFNRENHLYKNFSRLILGWWNLRGSDQEPISVENKF